MFWKTFDISFDSVRFDGQVVWRPDGISFSQWESYWKRLEHDQDAADEETIADITEAWHRELKKLETKIYAILSETDVDDETIDEICLEIANTEV